MKIYHLILSTLLSTFLLTSASAQALSHTPTNVYAAIDQPAGYIGGEAALYAFLQKNIKFPDAAKKNNVRGKVIVSFIVDKDGSIADISIMKDIGGGCGDEAKRVIQLMPKWKPAIQNGVPIKHKVVLPVQFELTKE